MKKSLIKVKDLKKDEECFSHFVMSKIFSLLLTFKPHKIQDYLFLLSFFGLSTTYEAFGRKAYNTFLNHPKRLIISGPLAFIHSVCVFTFVLNELV